MDADRDALQERYDFVLAACRDAQALASRYGWALSEIAGMDADGKRADDLGRAARIARNALLGTHGVEGALHQTVSQHTPSGEQP